MKIDYPQINFYTKSKSEWDSLFGLIPRLERIEKIDAKETYTDHNGTRTRPLRYVEYKSVSVQLIHSVREFLKPFDWTNWEEGLKILQEQSFTGLDIQMIGKLLSIILYYKESTEKQSPLGIACRASDLEDGRVLKLLKELKIVVEQERKNEYEKHHVYHPQDSTFASYGKLLQSKWRDRKGYPVAKGNETSYGHFIDTDYATEKEVNFLTENIRNLVIKELEAKSIVHEYIWDNLLSSKALCFNLFGELHFNHRLATALFKNIFPKPTSPYSEKVHEIAEVTSVLFDHSPYKVGDLFIGVHYSFDIFVEYTSTQGKNGFIGIDIKYAETLLEHATRAVENYKEFEKEYLLFATDDFLQEHLADFTRPPLFQLWRKHLMSLTIQKSMLYEEGFFLFLFPLGNEECYKAANQYRDQQKFPYRCNEHKAGFYWRFLDGFIETLDKVGNQNWTKELKERYLGK